MGNVIDMQAKRDERDRAERAEQGLYVAIEDYELEYELLLPIVHGRSNVSRIALLSPLAEDGGAGWALTSDQARKLAKLLNVYAERCEKGWVL